MREFIQQHLAVPAAQVVPAAHKAAAKKYGVWPAVMYLELHVHADLYTARTNEAVQIGTALTAAKRKLDVEDGQGPKRSRTTATIPYLLSFNPRTDHVDPPAQTKVNLIVIEASSDVNGKVELDESTQHPLPDPTYIHNKSFAHGTMKLISPSGENMPEITFVMKQFFQVSSDAEPVSPENNKTFLREEFYECGALNEVDLDLSLTATDIWLATELLPEEESKTCPAAGLDDLAEADMADVRETGVAWLVEPLHVGAVQKFSGTLNHKSKALTTRLAATINTFVNFVYHSSQKSLVLCDVQTMKAKGELKNVIPDSMAHTLKGKSGPGDHGKDGIKNFLATHKCNSKCEALGLDELDSDDEESNKE
ncbi:kinase-like domain-containing protein [Mycena albidolilacea]|uniref:Kinase-like domain-containing protein n=1 Tax=Mycena albidolilacea TaxID=1033008 RepID=A0AAD7AQ60_9AGAR|nr:kinase-like domain-containing protein [Mycena albidolilacea]